MNSCTLHYYFYNVFIKEERRGCLFRTSTACPEADRCLGLEIQHTRRPTLQLPPIWNRHHILSRRAAGSAWPWSHQQTRGNTYSFILLFSREAQRTSILHDNPSGIGWWASRFPRQTCSLNISSFFSHSSSVMLSADRPACLPLHLSGEVYTGVVQSTAVCSLVVEGLKWKNVS